VMGRSGRAGLVVSVALHAAALGALLTYAPARSALFASAPITVEWITPPRAASEPVAKPEPLPPVRHKPKPVAKRTKPAQPAPLSAAPASAPAAIAAPALPSPPSPASVPVAAAPAPAPVAAPAAITPAIFDADYLRNPAPAYPALSRRLAEQGKVVLRVLVNDAGSADEVQVRSSSGSTRLDEAARETVKRWKFVPARRGSEPVPAWVLIPISFRLEN
jgi:periplasmic protein TonB